MKKLILTALTVATLGFVSCSEDETTNNLGEQPTASVLKGKLSSKLTLEANGTYELKGNLFVKEGGELVIEEGVTIKVPAKQRLYILVERGGKINAVGTASNYIKITSDAAQPKAADWGGLIINGNAPISGAATEAPTEVNAEILFGGTNKADNSGRLEYVILEGTGDRIDEEAEHNGLTLNGVGNGTSIKNIAILNGDDDGIEFFGGTVNTENILVVNAKDDMFDFTQGYTGTSKNLYGIREAGYTAVTKDPRGVEADGNLDGKNPTAANQSNFTIDGLTILNHAKVNVEGEEGMSDAIKVRRGATANIKNAYIAVGANGKFQHIVDLADKKGDANANTVINAVVNGAYGLDKVKNKNSKEEATINTSSGTSGGADASKFAWTNYFKNK